MNAGARAYILDSVRSMGLQPEVQTATVQQQTMDNQHNVHVTLAVVHNIVVHKQGVAPGHANRPAVLVVSHYDSDADTVGAADGAAANAAMLETLRALQAAPLQPEDAIFLFADGDKVGTLGEQGFAEQHPLARQVGLTLRFRDLGNRGPVVLQEAHGNAGAAIDAWSHGPAPRGSSLMREVSGLLPGARDTGPLAALDAPLLQFAAVEGRLGRFDTPALLDQATLQHEGDTMLGLVREITARPLPRAQAGPDQLYFTLPLLGMVHYPADIAWSITRLTCLLLAGVCCVAIRRAGIELVDIIKGAFGYALAAGVPLGVLYLDGLHGFLAHLARPGENGPRYVEVVAALMVALFILLQRRLRSRIGVMECALGALVWLAATLVFASWVAPGTTYVLAWPIVAASLALGALHAPRVSALPQPARLAVLLAGLAPAVLLIVPAMRDAFSMLTPFRPHLPLWLLAVMLGLFVPLLAVAGRRFAVRAVALAGLGLFALPGAASTPPPDPPRPNPLVYYKDMPTWSEWWLARQPVLDGWSRGLFRAQQKPRRLVDVFGWDSDDVWYTRAERTALQFPYALQLVNDSPPNRHIEFDLTSKNRAPNIELRLGGGKPWRAWVNGRELSHDDQIRNWSMSLYGMEDQTLHFRLDLIGDPLLAIRVEERIPGVPAQALEKPLPRDAFIPMTGQTVATDTLWFR
jgi:hypothetical protein